jgi:hypothetical protein
MVGRIPDARKRRIAGGDPERRGSGAVPRGGAEPEVCPSCGRHMEPIAHRPSLAAAGALVGLARQLMTAAAPFL